MVCMRGYRESSPASWVALSALGLRDQSVSSQEQYSAFIHHRTGKIPYLKECGTAYRRVAERLQHTVYRTAALPPQLITSKVGCALEPHGWLYEPTIRKSDSICLDHSGQARNFALGLAEGSRKFGESNMRHRRQKCLTDAQRCRLSLSACSQVRLFCELYWGSRSVCHATPTVLQAKFV